MVGRTVITRAVRYRLVAVVSVHVAKQVIATYSTKAIVVPITSASDRVTQSRFPVRAMPEALVASAPASALSVRYFVSAVSLRAVMRHDVAHLGDSMFVFCVPGKDVDRFSVI